MTSGRILYLTPNSPLPMASGDTIRNFNLMRELTDRGWSVLLFSLAAARTVRPKHLRALEDLCEAVTIEPRRIPSALRAGRIVRDVVRGRAFQRDYFWTRKAARRLRQWLHSETFDVIFLSQLYMYQYLPPELRAKTVFDSQNAEARRIDSMAVGRTPRGLVARLQKNAVRRFEEQAVRSLARTTAVSADECAYFDNIAPGQARLVPNGVDLSLYQRRATPPKGKRILFMGSMNYSANVDAVQYLIRDILPHVQQREAELTILGSGPPPSVFTAAQRSALHTTVTGFVQSTQPYVEESKLLAVPLRSGGGTRLKILEALAQGLPVVSTSIGCEGLNLTHERDIVIADEPAEFASWIDRLLTDDELCDRLSRAGRSTVERHHSWTEIGGVLENVLLEVQAEAA